MLGCRQVGKAPDFDSGISLVRVQPAQPFVIKYDLLAQSVEHLTFNQGVPRSNRGWVTNKKTSNHKGYWFFAMLF